MSKVLVIGSGGREHSICLHLSRSSRVSNIYVLPGNAGTRTEHKCQNLNLSDSSHDGIADWCVNNAIELVVVGPEEPLIKGLADKLKAKDIRCFGPNGYASQLEGSKIFAKEVMTTCNIATADYVRFTEADKALTYLKTAKDTMRVIKFDGLAAGKGVVVAKSLLEAETAVSEMLNKEKPKFGDERQELLIEEQLSGPEISVLAFCDGINVVCFPPGQDHKRVFEGDKGPNTGGMGAYCPFDLVDNETLHLIKGMIQDVIDYMRSIGHPYQGILYAGLMLTPNGPFVLEFNCRFGDPETEVLLPQMKSDLFEVMMACTDLGGLSRLNVEFHENLYSLCVVLTSGGYPDAFKKGYKITGIDQKSDQIQIIHAGTRFDEETKEVLTNGGRVLVVVALGKELNFAYNLAMAAVKSIQFQDCYFRKDIGHLVLNKNYKKRYTYSGAGVNIEAGDELVENIKSMTSCTKRSGNMSDIGSFGALFDISQCGFKDPLLVSGTDGVGTKLKIAVAMNKHDTIGQDLVAMCVNDILCHGAEPLFFLDYYATGKLDVKSSANIIKGITEACKESGCSLIGGETAEMPGIYSGTDYDLAGFAVGAVERSDLLPKIERIKPGNKIIGLVSNGLHSNGFSLVRKIVSSFSLHDPCPFNSDFKTLGEAVLAPTTLYVRPILKLLRESKFKNHIHGIAHITGGGITENLPRTLPDQMKAIIDVSQWTIPPLFKWIWNLSSKDLVDFSKTFNLGIGLVLVVSAEMSTDILQYLSSIDAPKSQIIGEIAQCKFKTENKVTLHNLESGLFCETLSMSNIGIKPKTRVGVLISGTGTNLEALLKYSCESNTCAYEIVVVISNVEGVKGLDIAKMYGVSTEVIPHKNFASREKFDDELHRVLSSETNNCQLVCLAGFMRILSKQFAERWYGKVINIHPSLLPSFKGANAHREVINSGVRVSGASVHFVIENVDAGGIISQGVIKINLDETEHSLSERIKTEIEHKIYPEALQSVANGDCFLDSNNKVQWRRK